ncbi:hypothetical protein N9W34_05920, partial [Rickettsiales bacterium]|nr:hypothetical protein [Rickettsiales bacterium]
MLLKFAVFTFFLALVAGSIGLLTAPSKMELALMRLEDQNFSQSLEYYEEKVAMGDRSIDVIAPLLNIYKYYGYNERAIELMEEYVKDNQDSVEAHKQLAYLYLTSKYYDKYCEALESLQEIQPSIDNLRLLADTYRFLGKHAEEISALERLIKHGRYHTEEADYVNLASLYMIDNNNYEKATETLLIFFNQGTDDVSISTAHMAVQLLAEYGDVERAMY